MNRRSVVVASLLLACTLTPVARSDASTRLCHPVTDQRGDAAMAPGTVDPPGIGTAALDLTAGELASDGRYLTVAITVADLAALDVADNTRVWSFWFDTEGSTMAFQATRDSAGKTTYDVIAGNYANPAGRRDTFVGFAVAVAHGVVDSAHNEIVMTARVRDLKGYLSGPLHNLHLESAREVQTDNPPSSNGWTEDQADGAATYRLGHPSCLAVRKY